MLKPFAFFLLLVFAVLLLHSFTKSRHTVEMTMDQLENSRPIVKIMSPKNNTSYPWNTPIQYKVKVSDREDGESSFQEIASNEVFLQVKFIAEPAFAGSQTDLADKGEPIGLTAIKSSDCLNCHAFTGKLIGPSFYDICKRYAETASNIGLLTKRIREGSTGIWGNVTMPTHPQIKKEETEEMVLWILRNGADSNVAYYRGTEGYFTINPPAGTGSPGVFVITASYTDHGLKDQPQRNLRGADVIAIQGK